MDQSPLSRGLHKPQRPNFGELSREQIDQFMARVGAPNPTTVPLVIGHKKAKGSIQFSQSGNTSTDNKLNVILSYTPEVAKNYKTEPTIPQTPISLPLPSSLAPSSNHTGSRNPPITNGINGKTIVEETMENNISSSPQTQFLPETGSLPSQTIKMNGHLQHDISPSAQSITPINFKNYTNLQEGSSSDHVISNTQIGIKPITSPQAEESSNCDTTNNRHQTQNNQVLNGALKNVITNINSPTATEVAKVGTASGTGARRNPVAVTSTNGISLSPTYPEDSAKDITKSHGEVIQSQHASSKLLDYTLSEKTQNGSQHLSKPSLVANQNMVSDLPSHSNRATPPPQIQTRNLPKEPLSRTSPTCTAIHTTLSPKSTDSNCASPVPKNYSNESHSGMQARNSPLSSNLSPLPPVKPPPKLWADLLRTNNAEATPKGGAVSIQQSPINKPVSPTKQAKLAASTTIGKPKISGLSDLLQSFQPNFHCRLLQPRGLINNGNTCFMNAILQPLLHCPPFYNLLIKIQKEVAHSFNSKTPLVDALIMFMNEFRDAKIDGNNNEDFGEPFVPGYVYDALRGAKRFDSMKGRQEDAEEFLGFLLDGLHEELIAAIQPTNSGAVRSTGIAQVDSKYEISSTVSSQNLTDEGWFEVGPKNKSSSTRSTDIQESPISRIFGGRARSVLKCPGSSDSVTLQPFSSLQLDIQPDDVKTVEDALMKMNAPETVHDYFSPKKGSVVEASKRLYLEFLPPILILHLKRFVYDNVGGTQKLHKTVGYSTQLTVQPDIITPRRLRTPIKYKLFGVVYHHGKSATGGHYTCDILRQNNQWLHVDDTTITLISAEDVVVTDIPTQTTDRLAYLLFYMRTTNI